MGGGLEYAFAQNWSLKGEYLFARFQDTLTPTAVNVTPGAVASTYNAKVTTDLNIVRLGVNYKFSGYRSHFKHSAKSRSIMDAPAFV